MASSAGGHRPGDGGSGQRRRQQRRTRPGSPPAAAVPAPPLGVFGQVPHAVQAGVRSRRRRRGAGSRPGRAARTSRRGAGRSSSAGADPVAVVRVPRPGLAGPLSLGSGDASDRRTRSSEDQVQGLLKAAAPCPGRRHAPAAHRPGRRTPPLGEAVPGVARRQFRPRNTHPVKKRLRGAVRRNCLRTPWASDRRPSAPRPP